MWRQPMKMRSLSVLVAAGLSVAAIPALAHHSFAAEYDSNKPVKLNATVTKVEWTNPHARFYADAKDANGTMAKWEFELGSPNGLMRRGWTRNSLKEGDQIVVEGYVAKDGSNLVNARTVSLADGRKIF